MTSARSGHGRSGGAGTSAGTDFQARLGAWVACAILAEAEASPLWDWPETETFESVYAETEAATDDLLVTNSAGHRAFIQAKVRVVLSGAAGSALGSTIGQFVGLYADGDTMPRECDRLVLATSSASSGPIVEHLPRVLRRVRGLPADADLLTAAVNAREIKVLDIVLAHARREWESTHGSAPTDVQLRQLLSRVRVSVHDLEADGAAAREAKAFLRSSVLADPRAGDSVWRNLISLAAEFSVYQSGADRPWLQRRLSEIGVGLRATPSFRDDIERLRAHSAQTMGRLSRFATILSDQGKPVTIQRSTAGALGTALEGASVIVTGDPGAGKSAALFELAKDSANRDVIVLTADTLAAGSLGLLRAELGLEHEVVEVLRNWPGLQHGWLIVDALDAARGDHTQAALLDLIGSTIQRADRWRVAASIRRFDLRYNKELQALFATAVPAAEAAHLSEEFLAISHFNVPLLADDELAQLEQLVPRLHQVLAGSTDELRDLVRTPFNLRLLAELAAHNVAIDELEPITTQLELLEIFWEHRVLVSVVGGDSLEALLRTVCEQMIQTRMMRTDRSALQHAAGVGPALEELLSKQVLVEETIDGRVRREVVAFAHHVLFDYAVARLLFRGPSRPILDRTAALPELLLIVRPSYELHLRYVWEQDATRREFWRLVLDMAATDGIPQIGKIVGPGVAAKRISSLVDCQPLLDVLRPGDAQFDIAMATLQHLIGSRLAEGPVGETLIPPSQRPVWCQIASALSGDLVPPIAYAVKNILMAVCNAPEDLTADECADAGSAARRLHDWLFAVESQDTHLLRMAIEAVARTFSSDPDDADRALRRLIEPERIAAFGYVEVPELAQEIKHLIGPAPELASDIYAAAFGHEEESDEATLMRGGVLPLTSNRRQDYQMAHYALAQAFPGFLRASSDAAIDALASVRRAFWRRRSHGRVPATLEIDWDGDTVLIEADDGVTRFDHEHDEEAQMLRQFETWVAELVEHGAGSAAEAAIASLRREPRPAPLWMSVLSVAAQHPTEFAVPLTPLLRSRSVLASPDLSAHVGEVLKGAFAGLAPDERERVEAAIMEVPDQIVAGDSAERAARRKERNLETRDRLLGCLPKGAITTADARDRLDELEEAEAVPENSIPPFESGGWTAEYTERDELRTRGVDVDSAPNQRMQRLQEPIKAFASQYLNGHPSVPEIDAIEGPLRDLRAALKTAESDGVSQEQAEYSWGHLSAAADAVARREGEAPGSSVVQLAIAILLDASKHHLPASRAVTPDFEEHPSWSNPAPRVEAATGLLWAALHDEDATPEVLDALEALCVDRAPEVRFNLARGLSLLRNSAPGPMWEMADRLVADETSTAVLAALVAGVPQMVGGDWERAVQVITTCYTRAPEGSPKAELLQRNCVHLLTDLYVWQGVETAGEVIRGLISAMEEAPNGPSYVIQRLRDAFTHGDDAPDDRQPSAAIRRRALGLAGLLAQHAVAADVAYRDQLKSADEPLSAEDPLVIRARTVAHLLDTVAREIYFSTGAFDEQQGNPPRATAGQHERLYQEATSVLDLLQTVAYPQITHHVLETLEVFIPFDPGGVFVRIRDTIRAGRGGAYELDSLGAGLVVRIVERYLAEYRTLLQEDVDCQAALIEILDIFVTVGWPEARRLTYGLQDIFR
jgi:hypothetical protein